MNQMYTPGERFADGIIHAVGICAGVVAVIAMMAAAIPSLPLSTTASLAIYGAALLAMFGFSAAYNLLPAPNWKRTLRRLDQAAIFLKIAGTYTPFALIKMGGVAGYTLLGLVWAVALLGAAGKLLLKSSWDGVDIVLSRTGLGGARRVAAVVSIGDAVGAHPSRHRRRALLRRSDFSCLAKPQVSKRHLARVRAGWDVLSLPGRHDGGIHLALRHRVACVG